MTREEFIAANPIELVLQSRGIQLQGSVCKCPLHEDKNPSFSVNRKEQVWKCHAGCGGGSVIDLIAMLEGKDAVTFMKERGIGKNGNHAPSSHSPVKPKIIKTYDYTDSLGKRLFQVCRMEPKTFRQRHLNKDSDWVWGMEGVERVLYHLPEVIKSEVVGICEGEKDADTLMELGFCGTCNVGGAGKWLDGYTESLKGKDVLIFGDNDEPGKKHVELVFESIAGKVRSARMVEVPKPHKDITDFAKSFATVKEAKDAVDALIAASAQFLGGIKCPVYSMAELEQTYIEHVKLAEMDRFEVGRWIQGFRRIRPLVPGSLTLIVGDTGVGKTALLSSLALAAPDLPCIMFEIELPAEDVFERFVAAKTDAAAEAVEDTYRSGNGAGPKILNDLFPSLLICCEPRLDVPTIEKYIVKSELKTGVKPKLVLIDYVQLIDGVGKTSYERASQVAEDLKRMAKATRTIVVIASQIARPRGDDGEIGLHDAKNTGSLENSAGLVIGAWRTGEGGEFLKMKILKSTKGGSGLEIEAKFNGAKFKIIDRDAKEPQPSTHWQDK